MQSVSLHGGWKIVSNNSIYNSVKTQRGSIIFVEVDL